MLSNPSFSSNPWHSWHSPCQVENIQTLSEDNLFDNDMTSISNSGDHIDGATPAQSQLDTLPPIANASLDAPTPVAHVQLDALASVAHAQPDALASVTHVQLDASTSVTHVQLEAPTSVTPSDLMIDAAGQHKVLQLEHNNVWWTPEPEYIPNVDTSRPAELKTPMDLGETALSTSKRPMDSHLAPANKKPILAMASDKCCYDEVDYSLSLCKELYVKEGELSAKEDLIDQLRMKLQKKNVQLDGFHHQLELSMHTEVDRLQANQTAEMEGHIQEEITRLKELLQAEKERELANIKQHHSHSWKLVCNLFKLQTFTPNLSLQGTAKANCWKLNPMHFYATITMLFNTATHTSATLIFTDPTTAPDITNYTPIDVIKCIRKGRGTSKQTCLVGMLIDNDNDNGTGRPSGPELRPDNISITEDDNNNTRNPIMSTSESVMENAIAEGLATVLCNILPKISGTLQPFPNHRCMPHRKRKEDREVALEKATEPSHHHDFILAEVCCLFKVRLYITQDVDFITHKPASVHDVNAYEHEDGPTPNKNTIAFDLSQNYSSPWNAFLLELLLQELQSHCKEENWPIKKSDNYIREILRDCCKCLHTIWRNAQPKVAATGHLKTLGEVEACLISKQTQASKESRQATHCCNKYECRKLILDHITALKSDTYNNNLPSWQWLGSLIRTLGEHGISSEESAVENGVENILHVKTMGWH
ncbi:hypothetical protein EDC04DRAFT_2900903 [Pisolithus marmoratus]|nr:hypothetical protein EDC04DRAFT_2900903 [Pisolithus marmoratus]